jgi:hypothetical protein
MCVRRVVRRRPRFLWLSRKGESVTKREYIIAYDIVSPGVWAVAGVENIDISLGESV